VTNRVKISGWRIGLNKVGMTNSVRLNTGLSLSEAKAVTDAVLSGETVSVQVPTANAVSFVEQLTTLGAIAHMDESPLGSASGPSIPPDDPE